MPFGKTLFLEINRGCPHGCRFCLTGHQSKPFRDRNLEVLKKIISEAVRSAKIHQITLIGAPLQITRNA